MKIIQVTDIHLGLRNEVRFGASQHERLAAAIERINARHSDAALCVITGDLTDRGDHAAYEDLRTNLEVLTPPCQLVLGNHDRRGPFLAAFPETTLSPGGFIQSVHDHDGVRLIFLDTLAEGQIDGVLDEDRLQWLQEQLAGASGRQTLIFMHHPPVAIGIPMLDPLALANPDPFLAIVARYGTGTHLFFGHVHRAVHGSVAGVPFTAQRGLSVQFALDLKNSSTVAEAAPPSYGVILVERGRVIVHEEAFATGWIRYDTATGVQLDARVSEASLVVTEVV